jgi:hypothetical protein
MSVTSEGRFNETAKVASFLRKARTVPLPATSSKLASAWTAGGGCE